MAKAKPAVAYLYNTETRELYPIALKHLYVAASVWPETGLEIPAEIADKYIQSEDRANQEIVDLGDGKFEIRSLE